ncbi:MAG: type II toxin-antitoxin system Phd/YefM family antitoxin [bacterium]
MLNKVTTINASDARADFYNLVKMAASGSKTFEITLRDSSTAVLISRDELESWMETLDVMSSPAEVKAIRESMTSDESISLDELKLELENESNAKVKPKKIGNKTTEKVAKRRS